MTNEILQEPRRRLPILGVARRSYSYVWDNHVQLTVPLIVVFAVQFLFAVIASGQQRHGAGSVLLISGLSIAGIICLMAFAVGVHRAVLLQEVRSGFAFLRWDGNLRRYAGTWLLVMLMPLVSVTILATISHFSLHPPAGTPSRPLIFVLLASLIVVLLVLALIFPRLSLAFPAAAVGASDPIRLSWRATHGSVGRLLAAFILVTLPFLFFELLVLAPTVFAVATGILVPNVASAMKSLGYLFLAVNAVLKALSTLVLTVTLSLSYDALARQPAPEAGSPRPIEGSLPPS